MKSNNDKPYHHPDFHNLRPYLDPGFPNNYPYSQYVNNEGELVFTPWRDSEYPQDYCYSQYVEEGGGKEDTICELKKIEPLVLPTQYSSDESESDLEGDEKEEDLIYLQRQYMDSLKEQHTALRDGVYPMGMPKAARVSVVNQCIYISWLCT